MTENPTARLLDCGFCYEEQGEEVHPHPECPISQVAAPAAVSVAVAPTGQTALRDLIAAAMREHYLCTNRDEADADGNLPCRCGDWREPGAEVDDENDWHAHLADAVLAVLPPPADRAAVLLAEAARIRAHCPDHLDSNSADGAWISCHCDVADDMLRRLAAEAPAPETQTALKRAHVALAEQAGRDQAAITRHPVADHIRELLDMTADGPAAMSAGVQPDTEATP